MPRGVYDRAKMKKEKNADAEPVKKVGKPRGRKPKVKEDKLETSNAPISSVTKTRFDDVIYKSSSVIYNDPVYLLSQVRATLDTLTSLNVNFGLTIPSINTEIVWHIKLLSKLSREAFGVLEASEDSTVKDTNSTGTTYPSTVPMPPSIPSLPSTH